MKIQRFLCVLLSCVMLIAIGGCSDKSRNNGSETINQITATPDSATNSNIPVSSTEQTCSDTNEEYIQSEIGDSGSNNNDSGTTTNSNKETTSESSTEPESESKTESTTKPTACKHSDTAVKNKKAATCTNAGYTGDTYCKKCNTTISTGSSIQATGHKNTEVRNRQEATVDSAGYTGDTYCIDCGAKIATGTTIPKLDNNNGKIEYILPDGTSVWLEPNADITGYYMAQKTYTVNHQHLDVEKEILRLCNEERAKVGLQPLEWFEDAYCFTQIRANEAVTYFSHTRPNGTKWQTAYTDAGVYLVGYNGENLFDSVGYSAKEFADCAVEWWMRSPGHKANILNSRFNRIAIAIIQNGNQLTVVQNFFS